VLNDSKVFPSRLFGRRAGIRSLSVGKNNPKRREHLSGEVEVFLLRPSATDPNVWQALVRPGRKMRTGERVRFSDELEAEIIGWGELGERTVRFFPTGKLADRLNAIGHVPLPPYIKRTDDPADRERYQTVFARHSGSVAAPTAGLHFTPEILSACRAAGADIAYVTLHIGLGTFQPVHTDQVENHRLHSEWFHLSEEEAARMRGASRLVAVGTTSVRVIESSGLEAAVAETALFIYPGFEFRHTGALLTNFHLPRSTLLMLVCAFGGKELVLAAYRHAVHARYRFYSYGDSMLIV
jgi:S-adenosylmethionine:tRNA ribosyltransferase-isomerase